MYFIVNAHYRSRWHKSYGAGHLCNSGRPERVLGGEIP